MYFMDVGSMAHVIRTLINERYNHIHTINSLHPPAKLLWGFYTYIKCLRVYNYVM